MKRKCFKTKRVKMKIRRRKSPIAWIVEELDIIQVIVNMKKMLLIGNNLIKSSDICIIDQAYGIDTCIDP